MFGETKATGFNIDAKSMEIWSLALAHENLSLMEIKETPQGNAIFGMFILQQVIKFTLCCNHLHY